MPAGITVSQLREDASFVDCLHCGPGRWGAWSKVGQSWTARGAQPIASRAIVLLVLTRPGAVGRYRLYRPGHADTPQASLSLLRQGCLTADVTAQTIHRSFGQRLRKLPIVPCKPAKVKALVFTAGLNELSLGSHSHALVFGHASKSMWLTIAQTAGGTCKEDPLAYSSAQRHSNIWIVFHVKGEFEDGIQVRASRPTGRFCIYMQQGKQYQGFPDGWVQQFDYNDYSTGDVLNGPASTVLPAAGSTTVALSGTALRTETLMSYDLLTPCPEFSETAQSSSFGGSTIQVSGAFTETLTTATFNQSGYICSYLHTSGFTVAINTDPVTVAATQLKVQAAYPETADAAVTPVSDPYGNTGTTGTAIAAGQTVSVRCVINAMGLVPYDPVWYELQSAPWGDAYYAPAYAFYNNGQTSGAVSHGERWDPKVPFCNSL